MCDCQIMCWGFSSQSATLLPRESYTLVGDIIKMQGETSFTQSEQKCKVNCASSTVTKGQTILTVMYTGKKPMYYNYNQYTLSFQVWYYIFWSHLDVFLYFWSFNTAYCVFGYTARRSDSSVTKTQQFVRGKWVIFWPMKHELLYIQSYSHKGDIWSIKYTLRQLTGNILRSYKMQLCQGVQWRKQQSDIKYLQWCPTWFCLGGYTKQLQEPSI